MNFANYSDFRVAVLKLIDGSDQVGNSINIDTADLLIAMGETKVYQGTSTQSGLRASTMQAPLALSVASNAATLPADCLELEIVWISPDAPLEAVSEAELRSKAKWNHGGDARQYAQAGGSLIFGPDVANGTTIAGRYYQRPADIKTGLHSTFNRYPEVYLFAALAEAAPFVGDDPRIPMWEAKAGEWLARANMIERNKAYEGSRLRQKAR